MIEISTFSRKDNIAGKDYTLDDYSVFNSLYPYLLPKLSGEWDISLVCSSLSEVEQLKDTNLPTWLMLHLYIDKALYESYIVKHPSEAKVELSAREKCENIINSCSKLVDPDAAKELLKRVKARPDVLTAMLDELKLKSGESDTITLELVKKIVPRDESVYASSVCYYFLTGAPYRWSYLEKLIAILGNDYAFYAMRKYLQRLLKDKHAYLHNEYERAGISRIPAPKLTNLYARFMLATSPKTLIPLLASYDMKGDFYYANPK